MKRKTNSTIGVKFLDPFDQQLKDATDEIKAAFFDTLDLFLENQQYPQLRNHTLKNKFAGYRSIDITDDWRAIFKESKLGERTVITFHLLGTHKALYG